MFYENGAYIVKVPYKKKRDQNSDYKQSLLVCLKRNLKY